ncbi:MAG: glycoside hydrolase N-terminal domain-containing protein [Pirellulales bacterium]|nr:glycoside hydrolase N-terminal domain-containing protein [Pirellulales bacterium]
MKYSSIVFASVFVIAVLAASAVSSADVDPALAKSNLKLTAPIDKWDEAVPLGNGLLGGLLWGGGRNLNLSLDRGDLWDCRTPEPLKQPDWTYDTIKKLVAEKDQAKITRMFDKPYNTFAYPTKLPAGRIELSLGKSQMVKSFELDLATATGSANLADGKAVEVFFSAAEPVALMRVSGGNELDLKILPPPALKKLGYKPARTGQASNGGTETKWFVQDAVDGLQYVVAAGSRKIDGVTLIAISVTTSRDDKNPLGLARKRIDSALGAGWEATRREHLAWWKDFWGKSRVEVPHEGIQQQYDLVKYFLGSGSRRGAPPLPLQGVWTADDGGLPPWKGDYHHDTNTQMTYWLYPTSGHFDEGASFIDFMWDLLPKHREFAKSFYGISGAVVPGVMTLDGNAMGGWSQYSLSPIQGAWIAQAFYWHWRYTMDEEFLKTRAYPYCAAMAEGLERLLKPGEDGKLKLPLSTSPEIHDNSLKAWLTPNTNNDLSLLRWLFGSLVEMARPAGKAEEAARWQGVLDKLDDLAVEGKDGALRLSPDESLKVSHRHHSHLMAIYPLGILHVEGSDRDRHIICASLDQLDRLGTKSWVGFGFTWYSCIAARAGDGERALDKLEIFVKAFISRNGFNLNGDYKRQGYSNFSYRPFTLEANFAAAQAVHEMLLQSWGGTVRVFPAVSKRWADVAFEDLRAEGGFQVSAVRKGGKTRSVRVRSDKGCLLRLRDPFAGEKVTWNRKDVRRVGKDIECRLRPGEVLEGRL